MTRKLGNKKLEKGIYLNGGYVYVRLQHNGQPIREYIGPESEEGIIDKAHIKLHALRDEIRCGKLNLEQRAKKLTLKDACQLYWDVEASKLKSPKLPKQSIEYFKTVFQPLKTVDTFTYLDTQALREFLASKGMSGSSINRHHTVWTRLFNFLRDMRKTKQIKNYTLPEDNPGKGVRSCPGSCKVNEGQYVRTTVISPEELDKFCAGASERVKKACYGAVLTMLRKKDLKGLVKTISIDGSGERLRGVQAKTGRMFDIPVDENTKALIESGSGSQPFDFSNFRKEFEKAREIFMKNGGRYFQFRDLRRTGASDLLMAGFDLRTIQKRLGHASLQMTEKYLQPTEQAATDAAKELSKRYLKVAGQ